MSTTRRGWLAALAIAPLGLFSRKDDSTAEPEDESCEVRLSQDISHSGIILGQNDEFFMGFKSNQPSDITIDYFSIRRDVGSKWTTIKARVMVEPAGDADAKSP